MSREKSMTIDNFAGVDRRRRVYAMNPKALYVGNNVELTRGGTVRSAPIPRVEAVLNTNSIGLYTANGKLRAAVPAGNSLKELAPYNFVFDEVANVDAGAVSTSFYASLHGATTWAADTLGRAFPYIVLRNSSGGYEHHYIDGTYNTKVALPFNPGPSLVKQSGKLFAPDPTAALLHFSSTNLGPRFWDGTAGAAAEDDAGFIDVTTYSAGDPRIRGLTYFGTQLVIVFEDAVQFWVTNPNPAAFQFQRALTGPGTKYFGSVAPVISDLYYFAPSGFHSIVAAAGLGETTEGDIGAPIFDISEPFNDGSYTVRSLWSQTRSQYLCFFSKDGATTVFCYTLSPLGGVDGWTTWEYDFEADYIVEAFEKVYIRSGDTVYRLDNSEINEDLGFTSTIETAMVDGASPHRMKTWHAFDLDLEGTIETLEFRVDPQDITKTYVGARNIIGPTAPGGAMRIQALSHNVGMKMTTTKGFELSSITLRFTDLGGAG